MIRERHDVSWTIRSHGLALSSATLVLQRYPELMHTLTWSGDKQHREIESIDVPPLKDQLMLDVDPLLRSQRLLVMDPAMPERRRQHGTGLQQRGALERL